MMRRCSVVALVVGLLVVPALAAPAAAQQLFSVNVGYFTLRGESGRVAGDTLVENIFADPPFALDYRVSDFNGATFGAEWLFPVGDFLEGGVGVNYYQHTVHSRYADLIDNTNGNDILQDLKLRMVPISATLRFLPMGRRATVQPYVGAGVVIIPWSYSEAGQFADPSYSIFTWEYKDSGTSVGPVIFGGVRVPVSRAIMMGGEIRWQHADASLDPNVGFAGSRLDLGGITYQANVVFKF
jgi:hypothetical protein